MIYNSNTRMKLLGVTYDDSSVVVDDDDDDDDDVAGKVDEDECVVVIVVAAVVDRCLRRNMFPRTQCDAARHNGVSLSHTGSSNQVVTLLHRIQIMMNDDKVEVSPTSNESAIATSTLNTGRTFYFMTSWSFRVTIQPDIPTTNNEPTTQHKKGADLYLSTISSGYTDSRHTDTHTKKYERTHTIMTTKIAELSLDQAVCAVWCPISTQAHLFALGSKVRVCVWWSMGYLVRRK